MNKTCYLLAYLDDNFTVKGVSLCSESPTNMTRDMRLPAPLIVMEMEGEDFQDASDHVRRMYPLYARHLAAKFPLD